MEMSLDERFAPLTDEKSRFVSAVYSGLTLSLAWAIACCIGSMFLFAQMPQLAVLAPIMGIVELGLLLVTWFVRPSGVFGWIWLALFVTASGITLAPVILYYLHPAVGGPLTVGAAALLTFVIFLTLSAYVRFSGKDFSYMGGFLMIATLGLFLSGLLLLFFPSQFASLVKAYIGALVFCGWILYDTSVLTRQYYYDGNVVGAILHLYLDIVNLFIYILQIMSGNRRRND